MVSELILEFFLFELFVNYLVLFSMSVLYLRRIKSK